MKEITSLVCTFEKPSLLVSPRCLIIEKAKVMVIWEVAKRHKHSSCWY